MFIPANEILFEENKNLQCGNILNSIENKLNRKKVNENKFKMSLERHLIIPNMKFEQTSLSWLDQSKKTGVSFEIKLFKAKN